MQTVAPWRETGKGSRLHKREHLDPNVLLHGIKAGRPIQLAGRSPSPANGDLALLQAVDAPAGFPGDFGTDPGCHDPSRIRPRMERELPNVIGVIFHAVADD